MYLSRGNSIFEEQDSIWTYNCPCPTPPSQHNRHVCRFKITPATCSPGLFPPSTKILSLQFDALNELFYAKPRRDLTPLDQARPQFSTISEFHHLLQSNNLSLSERQCFKGQHCRNMYCGFSHSIEEMLDVFKDERVRHFYAKEARIKDSAYIPHTTSLEVNDHEQFFHCRGAGVNANLIYHRSTALLVYPYIVIECHECKRVSNTAVYR